MERRRGGLKLIRRDESRKEMRWDGMTRVDKSKKTDEKWEKQS